MQLNTKLFQTMLYTHNKYVTNMYYDTIHLEKTCQANCTGYSSRNVEEVSSQHQVIFLLPYKNNIGLLQKIPLLKL